MTSLKRLAPMLATPTPVPTGSGWAFEWKWDGQQVIVAVTPEAVRLWSRTGCDITATFPELVVMAGLVDRPVLLDGELVMMDTKGRPDFGRLQARMGIDHPTERLLHGSPVSLYAFDVLHDADESLLAWPYEWRRERLA